MSNNLAKKIEETALAISILAKNYQGSEDKDIFENQIFDYSNQLESLIIDFVIATKWQAKYYPY